MTIIDPGLLKVQADAPDWYHAAMRQAGEERFADVQDCAVHYLYWPSEGTAQGNLLLVHGGGGHAHWWSFIGPILARGYNVAAISLSGMGDSGTREHYDADVRVADLRGVIADAFAGGLPTFICGHSFGGFMTSRFGQLHGDEVAGIIVADSPFRPPHLRDTDQKRRPRMGNKRYYATFDEAWQRFRLMPEQPCANDFLVEHIARHSLKQEPEGWCWKWDGGAMNNRRFGEPFHDYLAAATCRKAYIFGEKSFFNEPDTLAYASELVGGHVVGVPEAYHHIMLDQPLAFVAAIRGVLAGWRQA
ncbi:alpha/beta fold hydrolase [Minwuia sp.]|uniref:alpha/beta fold hydrolase n=1 Tax=Minwuia sp. TaxID=2493630 RepID=UPI003A8DC69C